MSPTPSPLFDRDCIRRAVYLATTCIGETSPNPQVGAVLALGGQIVSEGLYRRDGGPHAEVDALARLSPVQRSRLPDSTMYVSLEPCSIYGRTPPCAERLLREGVGRVVVAALDFTPGVCGNGLRNLRMGGAVVEFGLGQATAFEVARPRNVFASLGRPYVVLKQAISADGYVGRSTSAVAITSVMANVISHRWRAEHDAILVGSRTFTIDGPSLTTRLVAGKDPDVVIYDPSGRLSPKRVAAHFARDPPLNRRIFLASAKPAHPADEDADVKQILLDTGDALPSLLRALAAHRVGRLLVEGGPSTTRVFAEAGLWDEYREWSSPGRLSNGAGMPVPAYRPQGELLESYQVGVDYLRVFSKSAR